MTKDNDRDRNRSAAPRAIRVNLSFGARTDATLWNELVMRPPYRRAKLLRQLITAGLQRRCGVPTREHPPSAPPLTPTVVNDETAFNENVMALLGKSLRA